MLVAINACTTDDLDPTLEQNKLVEVDIKSDNNVYAILKGALSRLTATGYYGRDYIINNEVRTDNCFSNGNSGRFSTQAALDYNANTGFFWDEAFRVIASVNLIIAQVPEDLEGDKDYIKHMQGQAYVIRALVHFDLLKQYGQMNAGGTLGVPYVSEFATTLNAAKVNITPARKPVDECVTLIMADLAKGFDMMDVKYDISKTFINKFAAKAIESNVALYFKMWDKAITAAEAVIGSGKYSIIAKDNFVKSFEESPVVPNSIFELAFNDTDTRGINGLAYIYRGTSYGDVQVIDEVANIFHVDDVRKGILGFEGVRLRNMGKYPDMLGIDNVFIIRYEEIILNYAEALLEKGEAAKALAQLNLIASNRGIPAYTTVTKDIILDERRKELMFEGKRFDDLMRTGSDIKKYSSQQNFKATIPYGDFRLAFPIPKAEMDANSNMVQNAGY